MDMREFADYCIGQSAYLEEGKPRMELSDIAAGQFAELINACAKTEKPVVGVARRWNASKEELLAFYQRLQRMQQIMPEIVGVMLPVNDDADKNHQTSINLDELIGERAIQSIVVPLRVQNYSWTAGLNGPAALLHCGLKQGNAQPADVSVFNYSFNTEFEDDELRKLAKQYRDNRFIMAIKKDGARKPEISIRTIVDALSGNALSEEILYAARNTGYIASLSDIARLKGYDAYCNGAGGMEDHEFAARLVFDAINQNDYGKVMSMLSSVNSPSYYTDSAWESLSENQKRAKLDREMGAVKAIAEKLALIKGASYETPLKYTDFKFE